MKLSVASIDKYLVRIDAEGEITMRDFRAEGPDPFEALLGAGWASHKVVLDFGKVAFLDSSAIGWLMTCRREFDRNGGLFLVHSIQPRVRQVLDLLRVGKALPLLDNERAALAAAAASIPAMSATPAEPARTSAATPAAPAPSPEVTLGFELASPTPAPKPRPRKRKVA